MASLLVGCEGNILNIEENPRICVEGWIENGNKPIVILTENITPSEEYSPIDEAYSHSIHDASVTITVNNEQYVLHETVDSTYTPPYIYTTDQLIGSEGMRYDLCVSYLGTTATASTTIPSVVEIDSITKKQVEDNSSYYYLIAHFKDEQTTDDWYKFFVKTDLQPDSMFISSMFGTVSDVNSLESKLEIPIYQGRRENGEYYTPFFSNEEHITVKFCHIDDTAYQYWHEFDKMLALSRNPLLIYRTNLPSNINGGLGYWFGYGAKIYHFK